MLRVLVLLVILILASRIAEGGHGHFNGGSLSFSVDKNETTGKLFVNLDVITGWVLNKGPCGINCTKFDVDKPTRDRRIATEIRTGDPVYFGNWTAEYTVKVNGKTIHQTTDLNAMIRSHMTGSVMAMNAEAEWEQELMKVSVELESENEGHTEDISFEGESWHRLTMQPGDIQWHIQAKIDRRVRNDTSTQNRSPTVFVKPFYRIKLNKKSTIHVAVMDPDGDQVKCFASKYIESGVISNHELPGVQVYPNGTLTVDADAAKYNYTDNAWGAIALTVRDYNTEPIMLETQFFEPYKYSLSGTAVQFLIQVLENLNAPEFVPPTAPSNHHFILYAGTVWRQHIYARSSENTTLESFKVMGRQGEKLIQSDMQDGKFPRVKFIEIKWIPKDDEIGNHIICTTAVDNTGVDAYEDRCFTITIKPDRFNHSSSAASDRPYFINLPALQQAIACQKDVTCILPLYIVSNITVIHIRITRSFFAITETGPVNLSSTDGTNIYESDLIFRDSVGGVNKICMIAVDSNGAESEDTCIQSNIKSPDPCASNPCVNGGKCSQSEEDSAVYTCKCLSKFQGRNCDVRPTPCHPNPCDNNGKCELLPPSGFWCTCDPHFLGKTCSIEKDMCTLDPCNGNGICKSGFCLCFDRYNGTYCDTDKCPSPSNNSSDVTCGVPECDRNPCNGNGLCFPGPECLCRIGHRGDANCGTESGNAAVTYGIGGTKFVTPTPASASEIICYKQAQCKFSVFLATTATSSLPTVAIDRCSEEIKSSSVSNVSEVTFIQGLDQLYTADVTVDGTKATSTHFMCLKAEAEYSSDRLCLEITFTENPLNVEESQAKRQSGATHKFTEPTPNDGSMFLCSENKECALLLYTNMVSSDCQDVVTADSGVHVISTYNRTNDCVSEVSYKFSTRGQKTICFMASLNSNTSQTRCFVIDVYGPGQDKCEAKPCQNDGDCFHKGHTDFYCVCTDGYSGDHCEKGECDRDANPCDIDSFCYANNHIMQCICPMGKIGQYCRNRSTDQVASSEFTDTAVPTKVTCVLNRQCTIPIGVSSKDQPMSSIDFGYVSPQILTSRISTETSRTGTVRATVAITPLEVGEKLVCVQTHVNKSNEDEICIKLEITSDYSSLYGFKDKPHFIEPSMPNNAEVKCQADRSCHVLYHVTPGNGHDRECAKVFFTKIPFEQSHIFTPCAGCAAGYSQKNCSIDVSVIPPSANLRQELEVCVAVELSESRLRGEERCFNITIESDADFKGKTGCQTLQCNNGGFCDAHLDPPVCFCEPDFSGPNCGTPVSGGGTTSTGTFISSFGVPTGVTCTLNTPCSVNFHMGGPQTPKPNVTIGYVDPTLSVETKPALTKSRDDSGYTGTAVVTPTEAGESKVCMQTTTQGTVDDELCMTIQVGDGPNKEVDKTKPYYLDPTPTDGTTILCKTNKTCYIQLFFPEGSALGSANDWKRGEERCFNIKIETNVQAAVVAPCKGKTCLNNGKCIADLESTPKTECICQKGFDGAECNTTIPTSTHLHGVINPPNGTSTSPHHFDGTSAIPQQVTCIQGEYCDIPFPFIGTKPPTFGYVDPRLNAERPTLIPGGKVVTTRIRSNTTGTQRLCLQTTVDGEQDSDNVDEVCIEVKISAGPNSTVDPSQPTFEKGTVTDNSTLACDLSTNCHIPIYSKPDGDTCPDVRECPPGVSGVYVFETGLENGACVTDAVYKTGATPVNKTICISAGPHGEERHIGVEVKSLTKFGPCQETHCKNGGKCLADFTSGSAKAMCVCPPGQKGANCGTVITNHTGLAGITDATPDTPDTGHFNGNAAIPKEIVCVKGTECLIPMPYHGTHPPTFGFVDPELTHGNPQIIDQGNTVTKVSSNTTGSHTICLQTTLDGEPESENIDEVCIEVKITQGTAVKPNENLSHFTEETAAENSTVLCSMDTSCRIPVYTKPSATGECAPVKECPPGMNGVHVFGVTKLDDDKCATNAVIRTGTSNKTAQLCLSAGPGGEEKHLSVEIRNQTEFGPCQKLHCQNYGKCIADFSTAQAGQICICPHGYNGTSCETPVMPERHLPGVTGNVTTTSKTPYFISTAAIPSKINCIKDEPCRIPIPYNGSTLPLLGFVDPKLNHSQTRFLPDGNALVEVTTTDTGTHRLCLQTTVDGTADSLNVDELCVEVLVSQGSNSSTDPKKSHFVEGSVPESSTVACNIDTHCHIKFYTQLENGKCPKLTQCPPGIKGSHVFEAKQDGDTCINEVVYKTGASPINKTLCIAAGPDNEEKHVQIEVKQFTGFGPCQTLHCENGGTCVANTTSGVCICPTLTRGLQCQVVSPCKDAHCKNGGVCRTDTTDPSNERAECICPNGYDGSDCVSKSTTAVDNLPGVTGGPNITEKTPVLDGKTALPKEIVCVKDQPCAIPFNYIGLVDKPPMLGHVSPGLNATCLTTLPVPGGTGPGPHTAVTMVTPTTDGTMKVCIQTTLDGAEDGENIDELCIDVKVTTGTVAHPNTTLPHFDNSTLTDGSKVTCNVNIKCHIPFVTEKSENGDCPPVKQCLTKIPDSFVLQTKPEDDKCVTDIVIKTGNTSSNRSLCVSAGPGGEERHYEVETKPYLEFGPCQKVHCQNGGKCDSSTGTGVCRCPQFVSGGNCQDVSSCVNLTCNNGQCVEKSSGGSNIPACACQQGFEGDNCDIPTRPLDTLTGVEKAPALLPDAPRVDSHVAIPAVINCVENKPCNIPLQFFGYTDKPPVLGSVDPDLHAGEPTVVPDTTQFGGGSDPQLHTLVTTITPTGSGSKQLCLQTTHNGSKEGINVDEVCIEVNIQPAVLPIPTPDPALPHFEANTSLPEGSTVICDTDMSCHLPVVTEHTTNGTCPVLEQCGSTKPGLTLFETKDVNGKCVTDVVFRTGKTAKNDSICLSAGSGGETKHYTVQTKRATEFGPCQKLHCENGGKCVSQEGKATCKCPPLMSGKICTETSPCINKDCNHGDCVEQASGHTVVAACACQKGFEGHDCNTTSATPVGLPGVNYPGTGPTVSPETPHLDGSSALPKEVVCYQNTKCTIPISYHGFSSKPPVLGHVGSGVNASQPTSTEGPNPGHHTAFTELTPTETGTHTVCIQTTVNGSEHGENIDEICVDVTVKAQEPTPPAPEQDKPLFYPLQAPDKSTFTCKPNCSCHLEILTKQNSNGSCSPVEECGTPMYGVKVSGTVKHPNSINLPSDTMDTTLCVTDVVIRTGTLEVAEPLCLAAGPDGEQRTFKVETKQTTEFGPCQKKHCKNGGQCDADPPNDATCHCPPNFQGDYCEEPTSNTTKQDTCQDMSCNNGQCVEKSSGGTTKPVCACQQGFEGDNCNIRSRPPGNLAGVDRAPTLQPGAPRIDSHCAVPAVIKCVANKPCIVPLQFYGHTDKPPVLGFVDQDLNANISTVVRGTTPLGGTDPQPHTFVTTFTPAGSGSKQLCIQTTNNGTEEGINVDEVCFEVNIEPAGTPTAAPDPALPHFAANTSLPDGSTVICDTDMSCHLPVVTEHTTNGTCPPLEQCGPTQPDLTLFETKDVNGQCVTDVVFRTGKAAKNDSICMAAGPGGETRNYTVETKHASEFGPCQKLHCENGGKCLSQSDTAICKCPPLMTGKYCEITSPCINKDCNHGDCVEQETGHTVEAACACQKGFEGPDCNTNSTSPMGLPGIIYTGTSPTVTPDTPHLDGSSALPKEVVCYQGIKCTIPISYHGVSSNPPVLGHVGSGVNASQPTSTAGPNPGHHTAFTELTPLETGTHTVCIQTTVNGATDGENIDEICVEVTVKAPESAPPAPNQDKPLFYPSQAPDMSTFTCKPDSSCHLEILTKTNPNDSCSSVVECGVPMYGVKVFDTVKQPHGVKLPDGTIDTGLCVTDVVIRTGTLEVTEPLCLTVGPDGERRTFEVETKQTTEFGPCQKKHCQNKGHCDAKPPNDAVCCCPSPYYGALCEEKSSNSMKSEGEMVCPAPNRLQVSNYELAATAATTRGTGSCVANIRNKETARKLSQGGQVTCRCTVEGKEVEIIKRNPAPASSAMLMSAGYGAAGMTGAMIIGVIVYVIVTKARRPTPSMEHVRPLPRSRPARRLD